MKLVLADTGPLRYLIVLEVVQVLPTLFSRVILPPAVLGELTHPHAPEAVRRWATALPSWVEVLQPVGTYPCKSLGPGESEAIHLAVQLNAELILLDEREARREAIRLGLAVSGTVGVLERAAARGLVDLEAAFDRLIATTFRIDRTYLRDSLERHRRSQPPLPP